MNAAIENRSAFKRRIMNLINGRTLTLEFDFQFFILVATLKRSIFIFWITMFRGDNEPQSELINDDNDSGMVEWPSQTKFHRQTLIL